MNRPLLMIGRSDAFSYRRREPSLLADVKAVKHCVFDRTSWKPVAHGAGGESCKVAEKVRYLRALFAAMLIINPR
jgi:hypothetical protein